VNMLKIYRFFSKSRMILISCVEQNLASKEWSLIIGLLLSIWPRRRNLGFSLPLVGLCAALALSAPAALTAAPEPTLPPGPMMKMEVVCQPQNRSSNLCFALEPFYLLQCHDSQFKLHTVLISLKLNQPDKLTYLDNHRLEVRRAIYKSLASEENIASNSGNQTFAANLARRLNQFFDTALIASVKIKCNSVDLP